MPHIATYHRRNSPVHQCDARVKVLLVPFCSVCVFLIHSFAGLVIASGIVGLFCLLAQMSWLAFIRQSVPLWVLLGFSIATQAFMFSSDLQAWVLNADALMNAFMAAWRIVLVVLAAVLLSHTTESHEIGRAWELLGHPLSRWGIPVRDIAMIASLALRFIPLTSQELSEVRRAQQARGAFFDRGGVGTRAYAWASVITSLFVKLYRRADVIAHAMEARCYGACVQTTALNERNIPRLDIVIALICAAAFVLLAIVL